MGTTMRGKVKLLFSGMYFLFYKKSIKCFVKFTIHDNLELVATNLWHPKTFRGTKEISSTPCFSNFRDPNLIINEISSFQENNI